ncbi:MAG TPA: hypothetical protein VMW09_03565 [Desulfatiglandales bacterium]|nr:hypothetical protein [Desulfatiglandales bacterium]
MSKERKSIMKRIKEKFKPTRYAQLEDIIHIQEIEEKEHRTPEEVQQLKELKALPVSPKLAKAIKKAEGNEIEDK